MLTPDEIVESVLKYAPKVEIEKTASKADSEPGKVASLLEALAFNEDAEKHASSFKASEETKLAKLAEMKALVDAVANVI